MDDEWLQRTRQRLQKRIAVWLVLTICFAIVNRLVAIVFLGWVTIICAIYTFALIALWCYFTIKQLH